MFTCMLPFNKSRVNPNLFWDLSPLKNILLHHIKKSGKYTFHTTATSFIFMKFFVAKIK